MTRVPRLNPGCDVRTLPLTSAETRLLSRVDGVTAEADLGRAVGLTESAVKASLVRLRDLGAIELVEGAPTPSQPRTPSGPTPSASPLLAPSDPLPPWDPKDLEEDVELDLDKRRQILDAFHRLDRYSYYDLLGVHELCDKKQIKAAYYAVAPDFHPDKYFRKRLGAFKPKAEAIFTRLTLAHDVLTSKERREQYDEYLDQLRRNRAAESIIDESREDVAAVEAAVREAANGIMEARAAQTRAPQPVQARVQSDKERREALARKLLGGKKLPPRPPAAAPSQPQSFEAAPVDAETMRQRYEEALAAARREQVVRFRESAMAAAERKDYAAASNAYRVAASLAPEDQELQALSDEAERFAAAALADGFIKQAEYEVKQERWGEAAISYGKVCLGRPEDAKAHDRVALCTLKMAGGNMRRAVEFGRRAVELAPTVVEYRVTLARAYIEAGLEKSALAELERAEELAPKDAKLKDLIAQTKQQATQKKNK